MTLDISKIKWRWTGGNIFFSRFEGTRGEKTQIFRTPADTEGKVVLMWMTGAYQYWTNYSTAINYAFV